VFRSKRWQGSWGIEFDSKAIEDLKGISGKVQSQILKKINWLGVNFEQVQPKELTENLAGFYKLRVGDYRVLYEIDAELEVIAIARVGHRREIYDQ
jgi:mRNA interferase RelE/StbE